MVHHVYQGGVATELFLELLEFGTFNAVHSDIYFAIALRRRLIGCQDTHHAAAIFTDDISNLLNGPRAVFELKSKLNAARAHSGQRN